ncbi:hypothetical protein TNCV_4807071 [Trichonephila clavipes]|nr:hypothetical protein TNCV_4807071 [Trichonephila clavipes]
MTVVANPGSLTEIRAAARKRKGPPNTLMEAPFSRLLRRRQEVFVADIRAFDLPRAGGCGLYLRVVRTFLANCCHWECLFAKLEKGLFV